MRKNNITVAAVLLGLTLPVYAAHFTVSFEEFSGKMPTVPFEVTTFEQDDLIKETRMRGDNKEVESVAACDLLIADETLPFELRCWAVRQKMTLCTYAVRIAEALDTGLAWLREHEEADPHALYIRRVMAHVVILRCPPEFLLLYDLASIREIYEGFFANHPADNLYVISARYNYGEALERLAVVDEGLRYEAATQFFLAIGAMTEYMAREDLTENHRQQCERFLLSCNIGMSNARSERWMPSALSEAAMARLKAQSEQDNEANQSKESEGNEP